MTQQLTATTGAAPAPSGLTYEQFLQWPHPDPHVEWVNGETLMMAPVSDEHVHVARFLLNLLSYYAEEKQLGTILYEPFQMKTGPALPGRSPDVFFVSSEHLARIHPTYLEGPADLCVEVISPESRARDRGEKFYEYEQGGVREFWLVDPPRRQAEFFALGQDGIYKPLPIENDIVRSTVLPGLWLRTGWLWNRPTLKRVIQEWKLD